MKKIILFFIACIGMMACSSDDNLQGQNVDFFTLDAGWTSMYSSAEITHFVINSEEEWQNFLGLGINTTTEYENIDFLNTTILAVADKTRPDNSYKIGVSKISEAVNMVNITVKLIKHDSIAIQQPVTPYCIVRTNKINKPISWLHSNE